MNTVTLNTIFKSLNLFNDMYLNINLNRFGYLPELFESSSCSDTFEEFLKELLDSFEDLCSAKFFNYDLKSKKIILNALRNENSVQYKAVFDHLNTEENKNYFKKYKKQ